MIEDDKKLCPKCGNQCDIGDLYCLKCSYRFGSDNDTKQRIKKKENYGTEGMALGMCFGVAIGTSLGNNTGIGLSLGMLAGLVIGSCIEKKKTDDEE